MAKDNQKEIHQLAGMLPEIYQPIYGYPEISVGASRQCVDRLIEIKKVYELLSIKLGRPLRVLDIGSSQGFFSFSLASLGASVHGIDFLPVNVQFCQSLAMGFLDLKVKFEVARVEDFVDSLKKDEYDLVLGLSVFHHVIYEHGRDRVNLLIKKIAEKIAVGVFEVALAEEPLYWGPTQHKDPRDLLSEYSFVHQLSKIKTHLSNVSRPLYVASNRFWILNDQIGSFVSWKDRSHILAGDVHTHTRRYFFSDEFIIKIYLIRKNELRREINLREYKNEVMFLKLTKPPFYIPKFILSGENEDEVWLVREQLPGELLSEIIQSNKPYDENIVLRGILFQLVKLERLGFYHSDVRTWNVIVGQNGEVNLIDYGSISNQPSDCVWPDNVFMSLFIFIHEILEHKVINPSPLRSPLLSPLNLREPYKSILSRLLLKPIEELSFEYIYKVLFDSESERITTEISVPSSIYMIDILQKKFFDLTNFNRQNNINTHLTGIGSDITKKSFRDVIITIVVPIYKDIISLKNCIHSLKDCVDKRHKILLINDHGPEFKNIELEILGLIKDDQRFEYHLNDENLGFVKTCNRAVYELDKTSNEILLLNSDTVVTADFLEELIEVIYLNEKHGVVCPRSNNASILTIPFNYSENKNISADKSYSCYLKIKDFLPRYSVIPTAVGFCMLIRRDLISNYGLFDEKYSPGYNEENDFSMRINRYGYSLIMSNRSYVFHCESKSFSKEQKIELNKQNLQKLLTRYPYYLDLVSKYSNYQINPIEYFAEFIDSSFFKKKRILFSLLDLQPIHNGTAEYGLNLLKYFVNNFSDKYDIDILTNPSADQYHGISKEYSNVFFESNLKRHYHLAFLPSQFFDVNHLLLLNRISLKIIFSLLDIIALRCGYLSSQSPFLENLSIMSLMYADGVVSISEFTKKDTLGYFSEKIIGEYGNKIRVIHLGLEDEKDKLKTVKKKIPFKKYVLVIGNQHFSHKSVKETIEQLAKTDINFCVVGCKEYVENDKYIGYPSGNLTSEHMDELLMGSELLVFPSTYEGFGLPILKGLRFKKKIVLLDNEICHEIAEKYNNENFIFYKQNKDIVHAVRSGLKKDFVKIEKIRTWEDVTFETEKFIEEVINKDIDPVELQNRWFSLMTIEQKIRDTRMKDVMISELRNQLRSTSGEYGLVKLRKIYRILDVLSRNKVVRNIYRLFKNI